MFLYHWNNNNNNNSLSRNVAIASTISSNCETRSKSYIWRRFPLILAIYIFYPSNNNSVCKYDYKCVRCQGSIDCKYGVDTQILFFVFLMNFHINSNTFCKCTCKRYALDTHLLSFVSQTVQIKLNFSCDSHIEVNKNGY